jgi:hypothetical protein
MALDYWYDGQMRRYWLQFCRIFEGFQYESGVGANGIKTLRTFPVGLAGKNRQVGHILRNGSENTIMSTPRITCEMVDMQMAPERRQNPNHVSSVQVFERAIDPETNQYTNQLGNTYTVERFMGIPFEMTMRVNIWTSNEDQKHQFMEQVLVLFNPALDIQTGDNPIDWTSLTYVELDGITWTNRELPIGTDEDIEISSLTFKMPVWLSPPAKVKKQNIINHIITNIGTMSDLDEQIGGQVNYNFSSKDLHTRVIVSPGNHQARMEVNRIPDPSNPSAYITQFEAILLSQEGLLTKPHSNEHYSWRELLNSYGQYRKGVSQFRLKTTDDMDDHDSDIIGIFDFHPTEDNRLLWTPDMDTIPRNTLQPISGVIDLDNPVGDQQVARYPGDGILPEAVEGQRYLLASRLPETPLWSNLVADVNDIIEFKDGAWTISFDASTKTDGEILLNTRSGKQLRWTGEIWVDAISGDYMPGYWRVFM